MRTEELLAADMPPSPVSREAHIEHAVWLDRRLLLAVGWFDGDDGGPALVGATDADEGYEVLGALAITMPQGAPAAGSWLRLFLCRIPAERGSRVGESLGTLRVDHGTVSVYLALPDAGAVLDDVRPVLRELLAGLAGHNRKRVLDFLAAASTAERANRRLSESLAKARAALREQLPLCVLAPDAPNAVQVDVLFGLTPTSYYLQGWLGHTESPLQRLTAVSPEGCHTEVRHLYRYDRPDVVDFYKTAAAEDERRHGFIAFFTTKSASLLPSGWTVQMITEAGEALETAAPEVRREPLAARQAILADLAHERLPDNDLRREHVRPALTHLEERRRSAVRIDAIDQHGGPPDRPDVSIVVPLYGRTDFLEHQLAQFADDPEIAGADLLYVLDSPELGDTFRRSAAHVQRLYPNVPFRAVTLSHNAGFAGANNIGASLARGRLLLLLNSDVLPDKPGWLGKLSEFYDQHERIGALAPKLLYEDDSLQHAGLYFKRLPGEGLWTNEHYFKGLHRSLPAANVARAVPAITAACMLIDRELYQRLDGLRGIYVQGDYEDTDLCLRLHQEGYESWYIPDVELYHLEGQSYPSLLRHVTSGYNRWLHTDEWDSTIEQIMVKRRDGSWR